MNTRQASLLMAISGIMWGTNPALIKLADWTPLGTAWTRGFFCAALLLLYIWRSGGFSKQSLGLQIICGAFLAANSMLFVGASLYTSSANAVLLMFTFPWITIALDFFFNTKTPSKGDIYRLLLGFTGIAIIVGSGLQSSGFFGDILALLAGVCIALHIFFSQKLQQKHGNNRTVLNAVFIAWLITIIGLAPVVVPEILTSSTENQANMAFSQALVFPHGSALYALIAFGILSAIPWLFWAQAIAYISGHTAAALLGIEVFFAALFAWLALGDIPTLATWIGGGLTLIAACSQIVAGSKKST